MSDAVRPTWTVLAMIGIGGAIGTLLRYGASALLPGGADGFPWPTLLVNVVGCAAIGAFMVAINETGIAHPLLRPFVAVGVLGGMTTFSTYVVDAVHLVLAGRPWLAVLYLAGTMLLALAAVLAGVASTRSAIRLPAGARAS